MVKAGLGTKACIREFSAFKPFLQVLCMFNFCLERDFHTPHCKLWNAFNDKPM
jgi:hypothetical protein